jgi:hypothetical protein
MPNETMPAAPTMPAVAPLDVTGLSVEAVNSLKADLARAGYSPQDIESKVGHPMAAAVEYDQHAPPVVSASGFTPEQREQIVKDLEAANPTLGAQARALLNGEKADAGEGNASGEAFEYDLDLSGAGDAAAMGELADSLGQNFANAGVPSYIGQSLADAFAEGAANSQDFKGDDADWSNAAEGRIAQARELLHMEREPFAAAVKAGLSRFDPAFQQELIDGGCLESARALVHLARLGLK